MHEELDEIDCNICANVLGDLNVLLVQDLIVQYEVFVEMHLIFYNCAI